MAITPFEKDIEIIQKLDDEPNDVQGLTPEELKKRFDQAAIWLKEYINGTLIPAITGDGGTGGASNIGAAVDDFPGETVQEVLDAFNDALTDRYTRSETNSYVGQETENLVETVHVDLTTGVITVTKKDGSKETFDTALEKVPATMALVDEESGTYLVITNVDGSQTKTDVSKLIDTYTFQNSAEVAFSVDGSGNNKTVTASIRPASIGLDRFTLEVTQKLEQYNATSKANADAAAASAQAAKASETNAKGSETAASGSASQSAQSAGAASGSASQAAQSAGAAAASAESAQSNAAQALAAKNAAEASATLSQSWTEGGTGIREGENTNNAKYWAGVAQGAAGGGVTTFNGRSGAVVPAKGDYTAEMVGARPESWIPSAADTGAVPITEKGAPNGVATLGQDGKLPPSELPPMDYDPAGSAAAVQKALTAHTGNKDNPHAVTAEQVGASRAVKGTYPIAAGQVIQAGDAVDVVEGKAQKTLTPVANVETVLLERAVTHMALCDLNSEYAVVANSKDNGSNHAAFLISKKNGKRVGDSNYANETTITGLSIARLSDTQFLIGYVENRALYVKLGTVSGNSISFSQGESVDTAFYNLFALAELTNGRVAVVYSALIAGSNKLRMRVFTLSSSSLGSIYTRDITGESSGEISATSMNDGRVCICYVDLNDGNKGKVLIAAVDSSNAVTWGDVAVFNDTYTAKPRCASNQKGNVVISYYSSSPVGVAARTCIVSGNTIIPRFAPLQITSTSGVIENTIAQIPGACVVSCENGNAYLLLNEGSELSLAATYKFLHSSGTSKSLDITAIANKQVLLCYSAAGNSGYGTSTILTASGNQIAGSFINGSQDAIALKSGTAGQSIEVIYSGTVAADWVTKGRVISSPGVYGAGVLDGVLQVWGRGRPQNTKMATGVFVGRQPTTSDPINNIELGFKPQYIVALSEDNSVARYAALPGLSWRWNKNDVSNKDGITITDTGFYIPNNATNPNEKYHFVAFG